jgi:glycerophosphoryl diester phosphodiesterase
VRKDGTVPVIYAHRGATSGGSRSNSLAAFRDALAQGITGLESDLRQSMGGTVVLHHDVWDRRRGVPYLLRMVPSFLLGRWGIPRFQELLDMTPPGVPVSVDAKERRAGKAALKVLAGHPPELRRRVYLVHDDVGYLEALRAADGEVGLMHECRQHELTVAVVDHFRRLAEARIDVVNCSFTAWTPELVTAAHDFGLLAYGSIIEDEPTMVAALDLGLDGIFADNTEALVRALATWEEGRPEAEESAGR